MVKLRSDLIIKTQTTNREKTYIIKDPFTQEYYRFSEEEYFVMERFDGMMSYKAIAEAYNEQFGDNIDEDDVLEFANAMRSMDLLEKNAFEQNAFLYEKAREQRRSSLIQAKGSLFYFRIPVIDPNAFFDIVMPYIRWMWSKWTIRFMAFVMLMAIISLINNRDEVAQQLEFTWDLISSEWTATFLFWMLIMITIGIHELGHGLTCKRFGGECREIGFLFMFLNPCMYANVNDAWLFENKKHRLYVTFAGCYVEFFIGSLATLLWLFARDGSTLNIVAFQIVVITFFSAIFMNFNPLVKFDGYFALSDFLEIPNLRERSRNYFFGWFQKNLFGLNKEMEQLPKRERYILGIYGGLSTVYVFNIMLGLILFAWGILIEQLGMVLGGGVFLVGMQKVFGKQAQSLQQFWRFVKVEYQHYFQHKRFYLFASIGGVIALLTVAGIPFTEYLRLQGVLQPTQDIILRTKAEGYVSTLTSERLSFGQGEVILKLDNPKLKHDLQQQYLLLKENELRQRRSLATNDTNEHLRLEKTQRAIKRELEDLEQQVQHLQIRAPFSGVLGHPIHELEHTWIDAGKEVVRFLSTQTYQAVVEISEKQLKQIRVETPAQFQLDADRWIILEGEVTQIAPFPQIEENQRLYQVTIEFPNNTDLQSLYTDLQGRLVFSVGSSTFFQRIARWLQQTIRLEFLL